MIKVYVRVEMSSEGESPKQVIERMRRIGALPVVGDYDFELSLGESERLFDKLEMIHHSLRGARVRYTVTTRTDVEEVDATRSRHVITHLIDQKPLELKKKLYKAKLERWREMGLDVTELEPLLEKDIEHFKEASQKFLKAHLNNLAVVKDRISDDNKVDGQVLALLDEGGKSIEWLMDKTGFTEDQITLSLGRLISSGSARRIIMGQVESYCLVPPPAPPSRTPLKLIPAQDDEEAEERVRNSILPEGVTKADIIRSARLPDEQVAKALASLSKKGLVRVVRRGKKAMFFQT